LVYPISLDPTESNTVISLPSLRYLRLNSPDLSIRHLKWDCPSLQGNHGDTFIVATSRSLLTMLLLLLWWWWSLCVYVCFCYVVIIELWIVGVGTNGTKPPIEESTSMLLSKLPSSCIIHTESSTRLHLHRQGTSDIITINDIDEQKLRTYSALKSLITHHMPLLSSSILDESTITDVSDNPRSQPVGIRQVWAPLKGSEIWVSLKPMK
jgi:hypothetical protein